MTEFLTENARRAYPLEHQWPSGFSSDWAMALLDASASYSAELSGSSRISLLSVKCTTSGTGKITFRIGASSSDYIDVDVSGGLGTGATVFATSYDAKKASQTAYSVFLTVDGKAVDRLLSASNVSSYSSAVSVGVPLALRCVTTANKMVNAVKAYTPTECSTPEFCRVSPAPSPLITVPVDVTEGTPVRDVIIGSKDGIDADTLHMEPVDGEILRISAIEAPADTAVADPDIDLMIRGDDCITVEAIPGAYVASGGAIVPFNTAGSGYTAETDCGVIRIGTKCKPCCQCEDYKDATDLLRPMETSAVSVKSVLDAAKALYDSAVTAFNEAKAAATASIASYDNIHASATASVSGGVCTAAEASGTRSRIAVTLIVYNMTLERAHISDVAFSVPGYGSASKVQWAAEGLYIQGSTDTSRSGNSLAGVDLYLKPGGSITVVATFIATASTNTATKPSGMTASFTAALPARTDIPTRAASTTKTVTVT